MAKRKVWAIVLNHEEAHTALRCLGALLAQRYPNLTVAAVDNDSGPDDVARLRTAPVEVLETGGNLGYAGGNNVGIRAALEDGADAVWIVNPDAVPSPKALGHMMRLLKDPVGIVGSRVLDGSKEIPTIESLGGAIDWEAGGSSILLEKDMQAPRWLRGRVRKVDFVPGASLLVRREVFEQIGLLPEEYFLYFEETEFCVRAADAGWRIVASPWADVEHRSSRGAGLPKETYLYYFVRNRILFGLRHSPVGFDALVEDVQPFIASWRRRVEEVDPSWLGRFEDLVAMAIDDARNGRMGRREGIG
jgi:GT2 family glycosyltransferase